MGTITVNGVRLAYDEAGAGPPLVWVHGGFTDRHGVALVVPLLAERHRVITYDRRGHSQSQRVPDRQGVLDHVADLAALIEQLCTGSAHVVGNSDGGEIALKLALLRPDLVASLHVHEPSLQWMLLDDPEVGPAAQDMRRRLDHVVALLERGDNELAARTLVDDPAVMGPGTWDTLPEPSRRTFVHNGPTWLDYARDPSQGSLDSDQLRSVRVPVLLSTGRCSDPVDVALVARLATMLPDVRHHTFADAGHVPHRTHPDEFARVVSGFVDEITAKA